MDLDSSTVSLGVAASQGGTLVEAGTAFDW